MKTFRKFLIVLLVFEFIGCDSFFYFFQSYPTICHVGIDEDKIKVFVSDKKNQNCVKVNFPEPKEFCGRNEIEISDISNLIGKEVGYEVVSGKKKICEGKIRIPDGNKVKFAVIGDTSYTSGVLGEIMKHIQEFKPDFVFHVGDFQYRNRLERWDKLFSYFEPTLQSSLFFLAAGNHEYEDEKDIELLEKYFPHRGFFFFKFGKFYFVGINTFANEHLNNFIQEKLEKAEFPSLVFIHKPFVDLVESQTQIRYDDIFSKIKDKAVLIFSGHNHLYGKVKINNKITQVVTGGGGATIYKCALKEGEQKEIEIKKGNEQAEKIKVSIEKCVENYNFVLCSISGDEIFCETFLHTKQKIDDVYIKQ